MTDKPDTLYVVSIYEKPHWRSLLTTRDKAEADSLAQSIKDDGGKARIETFAPRKA